MTAQPHNSISPGGDEMAIAEKELASALYDLRSELERAKAQYDALLKDVEALEQAKAVLERRRLITARARVARVEIPPSELQGMTQMEMLIHIAQRNGGRLKSSWARADMIRAGAFSDPESASVQVYKLLSNNDAFRNVHRGLYELTDLRRSVSALPVTVSDDEDEDEEDVSEHEKDHTDPWQRTIMAG